MKMPSKGTMVPLRGEGTPLFVGFDGNENEVLLKYRDDGEDTIRTMDLDEYKEKRVYVEQLPMNVSVEDVVSDE